MKAPVILLDYSLHCIKIYSEACGYKCCCDFDRLPHAQRQQAKDRRFSSFLGILAAVPQEYSIQVSSVSLMGVSICRDMMPENKSVPQLAKVVGADVPVAAFMHTTPLFNLMPPHSQTPRADRSADLFRLIQHVATPFHAADTVWCATGVYTDYIESEPIKGRHFVAEVWTGQCLPPDPVVLTPEQGKGQAEHVDVNQTGMLP